MKLNEIDFDDVERRCHYARWGYDGQGGIGPIESYEEYERKRREALRFSYPKSAVDGRPVFERARNHKRGHGWKANHQS